MLPDMATNWFRKLFPSSKPDAGEGEAAIARAEATGGGSAQPTAANFEVGQLVEHELAEESAPRDPGP